MEKQRLSKRMSALGLCSRREADDYIVRGWVQVDGCVVDQLGVRVALDQVISLVPKAQAQQSQYVSILLHKPVGFVSAQPENCYIPAVTLIQPANRFLLDRSRIRFSRAHLKGLAPVGRLDIDSVGLMLFTQDGRLARSIIGSDSTIEKEYQVWVRGKLSEEGLRLLNHGLSLEGVPLKKAQVYWQQQGMLCFILRQGKKRQIRRMCEQVGLAITALKRVRIGPLKLGNLPLGKWRYLEPDETLSLLSKI